MHVYKHIFSGMLKPLPDKEYETALWIVPGGHQDAYVLADEVLGYLSRGKYLTVRYWVSNTPITSVENLNEDLAKQYMGFGEAAYWHHYSEITGFLLFADEDLVVDGHDLLQELRSFCGMFIWLEIEFSRHAPTNL